VRCKNKVHRAAVKGAKGQKGQRSGMMVDIGHLTLLGVVTTYKISLLHCRHTTADNAM
jgi:hypothetical protein